MRPHSIALLCALFASVALAACGGDDIGLNADGSSTTTPDLGGPEGDAEAADTTEADAADLEAPGDAQGEDAPAAEDVAIEDVATEDVAEGDTVAEDVDAASEDTAAEDAAEDSSEAGPGACCTNDGCAILDGATCASLGATFHDAGSTCEEACPATGACCGDSNQCTVTSASDCDGDYRGDNFECSLGLCLTDGPLGACCGAGFCSATTEGTCSLGGGTWHAGLTCAQTDCTNPNAGACCGRFLCLITQQSSCIGPGSDWQGAGTVCDDCP